MKAKSKYGQLPLMSFGSGKTTVAQSGAMLRFAGQIGAERKGSMLHHPIADAKAMLALEEVLGLAADFDRSWNPCLYAGPLLFLIFIVFGKSSN